jgi:hypothetical protein
MTGGVLLLVAMGEEGWNEPRWVGCCAGLWLLRCEDGLGREEEGAQADLGWWLRCEAGLGRPVNERLRKRR